MKEGEIKQQIVEYLQYKGWVVIKMPPSIYTSGKGLPDLYLAKNSRSIWVEVKTPRGKLSLQQAGFGKLIKEAGIEWYVVMSLEDIMKIIGEV